MVVIKRYNNDSSNRWFQFIEWSLNMAQTQKERWEIYKMSSGYGISFLTIKPVIEEQAKLQLEKAVSKRDIWKIYKESPKDGETSVKSFRAYIQMI